MSRPKEPQFFAGDIFEHQRNITHLDEYLHCFESKTQAKEVGEASTCYLASPSAAERIKRFNPQGKIVVMLRHPVEVMYSLHSERVFSNMETIREFGSALDSVADRFWATGRFRGQRVIRPSYREMVRFSEQLHRYIHWFGRERVRVILYEDLLSSAAEVYRGTLDFLGVEHHEIDDFAVVNNNKRARSLVLNAFATSPGKTIRRVGHFILPKPVRVYISKAVTRFNTVHETRPALDPELKRQLIGELEPEIRTLSVLIGRDLSAWYTD
jgi:hypothetical protein